MNWISIKNQLPKQDKFYLCSYGSDSVIVLEYKKGEFYLGQFPFKAISYWMDLPNPPQDSKGF